VIFLVFLTKNSQKLKPKMCFLSFPPPLMWVYWFIITGLLMHAGLLALNMKYRQKGAKPFFLWKEQLRFCRDLHRFCKYILD